MVFKHNKQPFTSDDSCQVTSKHPRQLDCGDQLASFLEFSSFKGVPEKQPTLDGECKVLFNQSQGEERPGSGGSCTNTLFSFITDDVFEKRRDDITPTDHSANALGEASRLWCEDVRPECNKRPSSSEKPYQLAYKRSRQVDCSTQLVSLVGVSPLSGSCEKLPPTSVLTVNTDEELENRTAAAVPEDPAKSVHGNNSSLSWATCRASEEDSRLEPPIWVSFSAGYFEDGPQTAGFSQSEEVYSPVLDYPPRRLVAVGPNHQADIPVWRSQDFKNSFRESDSCVACPLTSVTCSTSTNHLMIDEGNSDKWVGTCVMPMTNSDSSALVAVGVGHYRTDCSCLDERSIRCVRQHVIEAREELKKALGQDKFMKLGFCDMGEDVSQRWSEEEEQVFHDVVFSNPASSGKNFWDYLPQVFPCRSSKELVSYYFNVFMLRKRSGQNRSDPLNVDSDNDEWPESDDDEFASTEEDEEDSVIESPDDQDDFACEDDHEAVGIHEEDVDGDAYTDYAVSSEDDEERLYDVSEGCSSDKSKSVSTLQPMGKNLQDDAEDQDVLNDSCTSYEDQHNGSDSSGGHADFVMAHESLVLDNRNLHREYQNDYLSGVTDHRYILGLSDPKIWDISYFRGPEKDIDFLPTCNMIEEVFGMGAWENEAMDGQRIS